MPFRANDALRKICAFTLQQAVTILDASLYPAIHEMPNSYRPEDLHLITLLSSRFENQRPNSHFIVQVSFNDGDTVDYIVRKCNDGISSIPQVEVIEKWLEEAKVCGAVNAERLVYTFVEIQRYDDIRSRISSFIRSRTQENQNFYYVKDGWKFKVGKKKGCGI